MKALIVTRVSGFLPQFEANNVKILQEMGFEVHYAANFNTVVYGKDNHRLDGMGLICHQIDFERSPFSNGVRKAYHQLKELMEQEAFDLIHCHMPMSGVVTRMAAQAVRKKSGRKVPVLYTAHGLHFYEGAPLKNWIYYPVERYLSRFTDRLILINEEDYQRAKKFPVRGKVYRIHGVGIDCEQLLKKAEQNVDQDSKTEQSSWKEKVTLLTVGELAPGKNHKVVLDALAKLSDPDIGYYICGEGQCMEALRQRVRELKLEKQVHFLGYRTDVVSLLKKADIFVFPSLREGMPVAVMEAMALACPVVAYDIRGCRELIVDQKGGILLQDKSIEALTQAIQELANDPSERKRFGVFNQEKVKEYSDTVVKEERKRIYKEVLREAERQDRRNIFRSTLKGRKEGQKTE